MGIKSYKKVTETKDTLGRNKYVPLWRLFLSYFAAVDEKRSKYNFKNKL